MQLAAVLDEDPFFIPGDLSSITGYFKTLLCRASSERPIYIFLDGVDQLSPEDGASGMSWLPLQLPLHVKVIVSTSSEIKYRCYPVLQSLLSKQTDTFIQVHVYNNSVEPSVMSVCVWGGGGGGYFV